MNNSTENNVVHRNRDYKISYIRAISTVMVVFLHIIQRLSVTYPRLSVFSDWINLGLVMFFVISAFLYSNRTIKKGTGMKWFFHRYIELIVPALFTVIVADIIYVVFKGGVSGDKILYSILSGLGFEAFVPDAWMYIQYWFLTYILVCYLTILVIQHIDFKNMKPVVFWGSFIVITIFLQALTADVIVKIPIPVLSWGGMLRFYLAYAIFRRFDINSEKCRRLMLALTAIAISLATITCIVRYAMNFEGIFASLAELLFIYTQTVCGLVLFFWLYKALSNIKEHTKLIKITDRYSYPVYLTHCLFIGYSTSLIDRFENKILGTLVALICTVIASIIVFHVTNPIKKNVSRILKYR